MIAEGGDVGGVERGERVHVDQEAGRLDDVGRASHPSRASRADEVGDCLRRLARRRRRRRANRRPCRVGRTRRRSRRRAPQACKDRVACSWATRYRPARRWSAAHRPRRVPSGGGPGGERSGGEHGVAAVHRFTIVVLDLDIDVRRVGRRAECRTNGSSDRPAHRARRPPGLPTGPSRAPCGRRRCNSCGARPGRARCRSGHAPPRSRRRRPRTEAVAPLGAVTVHVGPSPSDPRSTAASTQPAPRNAVEVGGPSTST